MCYCLDQNNYHFLDAEDLIQLQIINKKQDRHQAYVPLIMLHHHPSASSWQVHYDACQLLCTNDFADQDVLSSWQPDTIWFQWYGPPDCCLSASIAKHCSHVILSLLHYDTLLLQQNKCLLFLVTATWCILLGYFWWAHQYCYLNPIRSHSLHECQLTVQRFFQSCPVQLMFLWYLLYSTCFLTSWTLPSLAPVPILFICLWFLVLLLALTWYVPGLCIFCFLDGGSFLTSWFWYGSI